MKVKEALRRKKQAGEGEIRVKKPKFIDEKRNWISETESKPWVYHELVANYTIKTMARRDVERMWKELQSEKVARNIKEADGEYRRFRAPKPTWYLDLENQLGRKPTKKDLEDYMYFVYNQMREEIVNQVIKELGGDDVETT